jgi:hypothetical protein
MNKTFNFWTWTDTALVQKDTSSISLYGTRKNEVSLDLLTDTTKRNNALSNLLAEYKDPKQELTLTVPVTYKNLELFILDRVEVDYPTVYRAPTGALLPIYGVSVYTDQDQKILERNIDMKRQLITFKLRDV